MGNLAASWPLAATHGGRGFRNPLIYGEPAGTRAQDPRIIRTTHGADVQVPAHASRAS